MSVSPTNKMTDIAQVEIVAQVEIDPDAVIASPDATGDEWFTLEIGAEVSDLGLTFNGIEITTVIDGSWASQQGVSVDDEIHEVNGVSFRCVPELSQRSTMLSERPLTMKLKRPVVKDSYFTVELNEDRVGLSFRLAIVSTVIPGGWAERTGILSKDEIAEVNGTGFSELSDEQKVKLFKQQKPIMIKFKRPASTIRGIRQSGISKKLLMGAPSAYVSRQPVHFGEDTVIPRPSVVERPSSGYFNCCRVTRDPALTVLLVED